MQIWGFVLGDGAGCFCRGVGFGGWGTALGREEAKGSGLADRAGTGANLNVILETLNQKIQSKRLLRPGGRLKSMGFE